MTLTIERPATGTPLDEEVWVQVKEVGKRASADLGLSVCFELMEELDAPFGSIHEIGCAIAEHGVESAVCTCDDGPYVVYDGGEE